MVGNDAWDGSTFAIRQRGSQYWTGTVKVWKGGYWGMGAHGRRDSGEGSGQWLVDDWILLESCWDWYTNKIGTPSITLCFCKK